MKTIFHYKRGGLGVLLALLVGGAGPVFSAITSHEFSRYQVILDKKPFGEVTPSEAVQPQAALGDIITKEVEMKSIIDEGNAIRVGWLDKKTSKSFSLIVGEIYEGLQLVSVDYDKEEAVVKKGAETAVVKLHPDKDKDKDKPAFPTPAPGGAPPALAALAAPTPATATPFPTDPAGTPPRRPFFGDLKSRKTSPFQPMGTNPLPFQAKPLDSFFKVSTGAFPRAQSPFGPFQVPAGGAKGGNPFQVLTPGGTNVVNPFAPVAPQNPNADNQSRGQTIDQLMQGQSAGQGQVQPSVPAETEVIIEEVVE